MEIKEVMGHQARHGKVEWLGIRPRKKAAVEVVTSIQTSTGSGIDGDHYSGRSGKRHVTLIQKEHLDAVAAIMGKDSIDPTLTRRNIVVSGINLKSMKDRRVRIGEKTILEFTGECHPCTRMEELLGYGGYNAMRGMGGMTARVLEGGNIRLGDRVQML